jgi:hypothetical protein
LPNETAAAKIAHPLQIKLRRENMLNTLKFATLLSLAENTLKENNLQNSIFLNL